MNLVQGTLYDFFYAIRHLQMQVKIIFIITKYGKQKRHLIQMARSHGAKETNY